MSVSQISAYVEDSMGGAAYLMDYLARMGIHPLALQLYRGELLHGAIRGAAAR